MRSKEKALLVAELAKAKLAENIVILDMRKVSSITDFFVIASASSTKRCQAIAENIELGLSKKEKSTSKIEGYREGLWVIVDAYDVVAHIFYTEVGESSSLDVRWDDATRVNLCPKKKKTRSKKTSTRR